MNKDNRTIHGHFDLLLVVGCKYRISYGVNQGIYIYEGQYTENDSEFLADASRFVNIETGNVFNYFGTTSPYEFTSIVRPVAYGTDSVIHHIDID